MSCAWAAAMLARLASSEATALSRSCWLTALSATSGRSRLTWISARLCRALASATSARARATVASNGFGSITKSSWPFRTTVPSS